MTDTLEAPTTTRYPVEHRNAAIAGVNYAQRIIEVLAVPWEQETLVEHRGQIMRELVQRGAFDGLEKRPGRVRVNRDHDPTRTVGKLIAAHTSNREGMVTELRIAQTALGDETLALADDDCLSPSVGFAAGGAGHRIIRNAAPSEGTGKLLDRLTPEQRNGLPLRRIIKAYLDHIALLPDQAYDSARVLAVRGATPAPVELPPMPATPALDEWSAWIAERRATIRR